MTNTQPREMALCFAGIHSQVIANTGANFVNLVWLLNLRPEGFKIWWRLYIFICILLRFESISNLSFLSLVIHEVKQ